MTLLNDIRMYTRFVLRSRGFLHHRCTLEEARAIVQRRIEQRETNFLNLVEKAIFGYRRSPYLPLLKLAQVELGDIRDMLRARGLEATLHALREAGVYITFEEFKGREPVLRQGQLIPVQPHDFDNPFLQHHYQGQSGGTTGAGTRIATDLDHLADRTPNVMLALDAHGALRGVPAGFWFGTFPDDVGINETLTHIGFGQTPVKWFAPVVASDVRQSLKYPLATYGIIALLRLHGIAAPFPQRLRLDEAAVVARWMAHTLETHGACLLRTLVSLAVRVCIAASEAGLGLSGAAIMVGGEAPTPAKVRQIAASGAHYMPNYFFSEAGVVGMGCASPADENDNHFFHDMLALIQHPRPAPGLDLTVNAFHFTSLLPSAPKVLLNVQSDDYGLVEQRTCGCPLGDCGFTQHLRFIRSFRKLTGEGVTLVGSEMVRILEEVLPARFGGSALDYQLWEEEDDQGFTRVSLVVSPRVAIENEQEVIAVVLQSLQRSSAAADLAQAYWRQAGTLRVKRAEPVWTARGKLMPLHVVPPGIGIVYSSTGQSAHDCGRGES